MSATELAPAPSARAAPERGPGPAGGGGSRAGSPDGGRDTAGVLLLSLAVTLGGLALYVLTMAPTVLWGDDAELQRIVVTGEARTVGQSGGASHLLWLALARPFVRWTAWLPLDAAGRATLLTALCAALALPAVAAAGAQLARPLLARPALAGGAAALALALSHTFWLLAVRPDAYTLQTALLALLTWAGLRWRRAGRPWLVLLAAAALVGALANHLMILASLPGLLVLSGGGRYARRHPLAAAAGFAVLAAAGALGAALLRPGTPGAGGPAAELVAAVTRFRPGLPGGRGLLQAAAYLVYQFPLSIVLGGAGAAGLWRRDREAALGLALLYAGNVLLALTLRVRDQFVFFLPSYVPVALLVGVGAGLALERARRAAAPGLWRGVLGASLVAPLAVYALAAGAGGVAADRLQLARRLPGRDPVLFYLWPAKTGYAGARDYGRAALAGLPPGAVVVGDWLPYQTLRYLQAVEGRRPDVELVQLNAGEGRQLGFLRRQGARPLYLADDSPSPYYEMDDIRRCFAVQAEGVVYRLTPAPGCPAG